MKCERTALRAALIAALATTFMASAATARAAAPQTSAESAKLEAALAPEGAELGTAVLHSHVGGVQRIFVGAPGGEGAGGSVLVYRADSAGHHELEAKLLPPEALPGDRFGQALVTQPLAADWIALFVGAPHDSSTEPSAGAVHVYELSGGQWSFAQKILPVVPQAGGRFGAALEVYADDLFIGAPGEAHGAPRSGVVYRYELTGATPNLADAYTPLLPSGDDLFGSALATDGGRIAIGAPGGAGFVRVLRRKLDAQGEPYWTRMPKVSQAGTAAFGESVGLLDGKLVVGAPLTDGGRGRLVFFREVPDPIDDAPYFEYREEYDGFSADSRLGTSLAISRSYLSTPFYWVAASAPGREDIYTFRGEDWFDPYDVVGLWGAASGEEPVRDLDLYEDELFAGAARRALGGLEVGAAVHYHREGGHWHVEETLYGAEADALDHGGSAVAVDGDLAVVGMPGDDDALPGAGAALVFERGAGGWTQVARLTAGEHTQRGAAFGSSVAIEGERIAVGAPLADAGAVAAGATFVFERDAAGAWTQVAWLPSPAPSTDGRFGASIDLAADLCAIGQPGDGAAAVYERSTAGDWLLATSLFGGGAADSFGAAVATDGELVVVGAPTGGALGAGALYAFERASGWQLVQSFGDGGAGAELGRALALADGELAAGAPGEAAHAGSVHVYSWQSGSFAHETALALDGGVAAERYGSSVALDAGRLAVGVERRDEGGADSGLVALYSGAQASWTEETRLVASDGAAEDRLGAAVALSGDVLIGGAPGHDGLAEDAGAAYVLELEEEEPIVPFGFGDGSSVDCPCDNDSAPGAGAGCLNTSGHGARLGGSGSTSVTLDDLELACEHLIPNQPALLFSGHNALPGAAFGAGLRFVGGNVQRLGVRVPDAGGDATWGPGLSALGDWQPGDQRFLQTWYRDPSPTFCNGAGFNLSNGLAVTFTD